MRKTRQELIAILKSLQTHEKIIIKKKYETIFHEILPIVGTIAIILYLRPNLKTTPESLFSAENVESLLDDNMNYTESMGYIFGYLINASVGAEVIKKFFIFIMYNISNYFKNKNKTPALEFNSSIENLTIDELENRIKNINLFIEEDEKYHSDMLNNRGFLFSTVAFLFYLNLLSYYDNDNTSYLFPIYSLSLFSYNMISVMINMFIKPRFVLNDHKITTLFKDTPDVIIETLSPHGCLRVRAKQVVTWPINNHKKEFNGEIFMNHFAYVIKENVKDLITINHDYNIYFDTHTNFNNKTIVKIYKELNDRLTAYEDCLKLTKDILKGIKFIDNSNAALSPWGKTYYTAMNCFVLTLTLFPDDNHFIEIINSLKKIFGNNFFHEESTSEIKITVNKELFERKKDLSSLNSKLTSYLSKNFQDSSEKIAKEKKSSAIIIIDDSDKNRDDFPPLNFSNKFFNFWNRKLSVSNKSPEPDEVIYRLQWANIVYDPTSKDQDQNVYLVKELPNISAYVYFDLYKNVHFNTDKPAYNATLSVLKSAHGRHQTSNQGIQWIGKALRIRLGDRDTRVIGIPAYKFKFGKKEHCVYRLEVHKHKNERRALITGALKEFETVPPIVTPIYQSALNVNEKTSAELN